MLSNLNYFSTVAVVVFAASFVFGIMVFLANKFSLENRAFLKFSLSVSLVSALYFFWASNYDPVYQQLLFKIMMIVSMYVPYYFYKFVKVLSRSAPNMLDRVIGFPPIIFIGLTLLNLSFGEYRDFGPFNSLPIAYPYFIFYLVYVFAVSIYSFYIIFNLIRLSENFIYKKQLTYLLVGFVLTFGFGIINILPMYKIDILPYTNIMLISYVVAMAVAIFKYNLFNMKLFFTEFFVYAILAAILFRAIFSASKVDMYINLAVLVFVAATSYFLIKNMLEEKKQKEMLERQNAALAIANSQLQTLDSKKTEFINIASHQLRTPVTAIKGYVELLLDGSYGEINETANKQILRIKDLTAQVLHLLTDMLNLSRVEENRLDYRFEEVELNELVNNLCKNFEVAAVRKGLGFNYNIMQEKVKRPIDKTLFAQSVENILDNALKYTSSGGIKIITYTKNNNFYFECVDTGIGIDEKSIETLFRKFARSANAIRSGLDGSGIGMYLAREIVKAHGGEIELQSQGEGKGTRAILIVPLNFTTPNNQ